MSGTCTALFPTRIPERDEAMSSEEHDAFRDWHRTESGAAFYAALARHLVDRIRVRAGTVLSIGEGEGEIASRMAALLPGARIVGLDLAHEVVGAARRRHAGVGNLSFREAGVEDAPGFGPAEAVVCVQAFHHFARPREGLLAMVEALAPGGRLVVIDLRRDADVAAYGRRLEGYRAAGRTVKARLLEASVAAAHTLGEIHQLSEALVQRGARVTLEPFTLGRLAREAYLRIDPGSLAAVEADLASLMFELTIEAKPGAAWD